MFNPDLISGLGVSKQTNKKGWALTTGTHVCKVSSKSSYCRSFSEHKNRYTSFSLLYILKSSHHLARQSIILSVILSAGEKIYLNAAWQVTDSQKVAESS